jgi:tetratricopeptide (TPR) repeat protein
MGSTSYRCSNPDCGVITIGPAADPEKTVNLGVAAHITAASPGGPRYDPTLLPSQRQSADNGLWLCQTCSALIDKDVPKYPVELLREWKLRAEEEAAGSLGKGAALHGASAETVAVLSGQLAAPLAQQLSAVVLAAIQAPAQPSPDAIDAALDEAKQELERHQPDLARRLAQRALTRYASSLSGWQRYRAEALVAGAYIAEGGLHHAGQLLVDARRHDPSSEKARINEAVGHELLGQTGRAHELACLLRQEMPASPPVLALWVRTAPRSMPPTELEDGASLLAGTNAEVAIALAAAFLFRGEAERAEPHALTATRLEPGAPQAWLLLGQAIHNRGHAAVCIAERSALLGQAESHYTRSVDLAHDQQYRHLEAAARLSRAVVRDLLGKADHAGDDFRESLRLAPADADSVRRHALFLSTHGRQDDAINEARRAAKMAPTPLNEFILGGLLYERSRGGDCEEAVGLFRRILDGGETEQVAEVYELTTACLCRLERFPDARAILEAGRGDRLSEVGRLALLGRVSIECKDRPGAERHAEDALKAVDGATNGADRRRLADLLMRLGRHADAVPLLERIARPGAFDDATQMLLDSARIAGHHGVILRVCRQLRDAGLDDQRVWRLETEVLSIYDRPAAIEALQEYLSRHPDDRLARLRLSLLGMQSERPELVVADPAQLPSPEEAQPATVGRAVIGVLQRAGQPAEALRFAYTLLRRRFEDPDANLYYLMLFFQTNHGGWPVDDPEVVGLGAAVCYREVGVEEERWLVIENDAPQEARGEFPSDHPRIRPMLGLRVGEQFLLAPGVQPRMGEVLHIRSKYVFRFERCRDEYQTTFPERQDFQIVRLVRRGSGSEGELDLRPIFESLDQRRQGVLEAANAYATHMMPFHFFGHITGRDVFEVMDFLTSRPDIGIRAWLGGPAEGEVAARHLAEAKAVVLDLTALFTVWRLDLIGLLESWGQLKLVISQGTFDRLRDNAETFGLSAHHARMFADGRGGYVWQELAEEARGQIQDSLQRLVHFARERCEVLCCRELADLAPERRLELTQMFGRDGLESMCLAARPGHVLWTDDATAAAVAQETFKAERRVWTQLLVRAADEGNLPVPVPFLESSARLIGYGYANTVFDPSTLYWAAMMAGWSYRGWPFHQALRYFRTDGIEASQRQRVAAAFLALVFRLETSDYARHAVLGATLTSFANHRLVQSLGPYIDTAFGQDRAGALNLRRLVATWLRNSLQFLR